MIKTITNCLVILLIVFAAIWMVKFNPDSVTVNLSETKSFTTNGGVAFISLFIVGFLAAAFFGLYFGLKSWFREKSFQRQEKSVTSFYEGLIKARNLTASADWDKAKVAWEKIIKKDPTMLMGRVELAKVLHEMGDNQEALKVLDTARSVDPTNSEVLLLAAKLHEKNNNKTVSIDNLALTLYHQPNKYAAKKARDLSEELGRIDDAIEYQQELEKLGCTSKEAKEAKTRLQFLKAEKDLRDSDKEVQKKTLTSLLKKSKDYAPLLSKVAELEAEDGNYDKAAQYLVNAAKSSESSTYWHQAVNLWVDNNMADNAISAAKTAIRDTKGIHQLNANVDLIKLYIDVSNLTEAKELIDSMPEVAKKEEMELPTEIVKQLLVLKGLCLNRMGEYKESAEVWKKLVDANYALSVKSNGIPKDNTRVAPSPVLSTP